MAFQDRAERLASTLHLTAVPRPVFLGIAALLVILVAAALGATVLSGTAPTFEVHATEDQAAEEVEEPEEGGAESASGEAEADVVLPEATAAEAPRLCVHVDGAVLAPGVYYLDAGSRIVDAVAAAGGLADTARTEAVNLARELQDGEQVVIPDESDAQVLAPSAGEGAGQEASSTAGGLIDINRAAAADLVSLPGVGEATAEKIIADREANGPFKTVDDLKRVSGIGDKKFEALRDLICV